MSPRAHWRSSETCKGSSRGISWLGISSYKPSRVISWLGLRTNWLLSKNVSVAFNSWRLPLIVDEQLSIQYWFAQVWLIFSFSGTHNTLGNVKDSTSLTMATNYSNIIEYLEHVLEKSRAKYDASAYLHWYWKHGCTQVCIGAQCYRSWFRGVISRKLWSSDWKIDFSRKCLHQHCLKIHVKYIEK
jgi:hypothetical protein